VKKNLVVLIILLIVLVGAIYYCYGQYRKLNPRPMRPEPGMQSEMVPGMQPPAEQPGN